MALGGGPATPNWPNLKKKKKKIIWPLGVAGPPLRPNLKKKKKKKKNHLALGGGRTNFILF
jgi:hypothetical protein